MYQPMNKKLPPFMASAKKKDAPNPAMEARTKVAKERLAKLKGSQMKGK